MINGKSVLAIIPARGGSKGLPGKNILPLNGKPLLGWPVEAARSSQYVDRVIVSTDDEEIAGVAREQGAEVPFLRPSELASDTSTTMSVLEHAIMHFKKEGCEYEYCVLLEPTSPLTESTDVDNALEKLDSNRDIADSIVGVSKVEAAHPTFDVFINKKGLIEPYLPNGFSRIGRRQDLDDLYFFEGTVYVSKIPALLEKKSFYHDKTIAYVVPRWKSVEVDEMADLICVEAIMKNKDKIKSQEVLA
ncbi:MAG: acylneuraminate cytidylyltransferase family protein [Candidatus Omnitrophica bacterium]|nr:acylneuraminate cytidylyltransferase family protein [Candidatus Omnitrophota bacterium]